jgi:hypothetical protein
MADSKNDPTRAEEDWNPRKLTALGVVTILIVLAILFKISP